MTREIAIVVFPGFTALDAVGPYEVLSRLPGFRTRFVAEKAGLVKADSGMLVLEVDTELLQVPAPEVVVVSGGPGQGLQMQSGALRHWLRSVAKGAAWTTSVCTGSLLLGGAGLLSGRRATTHWLAMKELARYGATPVAERVVVDGPVITAAGVSAGIDMALVLAARLAGDLAAQTIQLAIEYDPRPPFHAGSPGSAPAQAVASLRQRSRFDSAREG